MPFYFYTNIASWFQTSLRALLEWLQGMHILLDRRDGDRAACAPPPAIPIKIALHLRSNFCTKLDPYPHGGSMEGTMRSNEHMTCFPNSFSIQHNLSVDQALPFSWQHCHFLDSADRRLASVCTVSLKIDIYILPKFNLLYIINRKFSSDFHPYVKLLGCDLQEPPAGFSALHGCGNLGT